MTTTETTVIDASGVAPIGGQLHAASRCEFDLSRAGAHPLLGADDIHVWYADLADEAAASAFPVLSASERVRAASFHFACDRRAFVVRRAALRGLIGGYIGERAADVTLTCARQGKPVLAAGSASLPLKFNMAWSATRAVFAFARSIEVGVDIERIKPCDDPEDLVARVCSPTEVRRFLRLDRTRRGRAFYLIWTVKEACVKAIGQGLHMAVDQIDVTVPDPMQPAQAIATAVDGQPWLTITLPLGRGYCGAVATRSRNARLRHFRYQNHPFEHARGADFDKDEAVTRHPV